MKKKVPIDFKVSAASRGRRSKKKKRRKLSKRRGVEVKEKAKEEGVTPLVEKYWLQRYDLFSRYDEGIKMDEEGWFSVTPEEIAVRHAEMSRGGVVIDCFTGVGGNAIQFAKMWGPIQISNELEKLMKPFDCLYVLALRVVTLLLSTLMLKRLNWHTIMQRYMEDYIDFIVGDFFQLASSLKGDIAFLSPPWGGPSYKAIENFTLDRLKPKDGYSMFQVAQTITPNIIMFLPRNIDLHQVEELSWLSSPPLSVEIEENYLQSNFKGITAYFGETSLWQLSLSYLLKLNSLASNSSCLQE